jgi:hypothetical protein
LFCHVVYNTDVELDAQGIQRTHFPAVSSIARISLWRQ